MDQIEDFLLSCTFAVLMLAASVIIPFVMSHRKGH